MKKILFIFFLFIFSFNLYSQKEYQSLFWKIYGNGLSDTSYLYGTMHLQDERIFQFKDGVSDAFNRSEIYAMELNMDSLDPNKLMAELVMESPNTLESLLSEKDYELINQYYIDSLGISLFIFNKMQPIYTAQMISLKDMEKQKDEALDIYFFKEAKKQNKTTIGLEFMDEQINAFKSIPYDMQANELLRAVEEAISGTNMQIDELIEYYINGDLDKLLDLTLETDYADEKINNIFQKVFLIERNHKMANRSEKYIKRGATFIAVGAAHLPGKEGVIENLRAKGYTVTAH